MIYNELSTINIFCEFDDFCKKFLPFWKKQLIKSGKQKRADRKDCLSTSEIMTILILFQTSGYKNFKAFYTGHFKNILKLYFSKLPCYNRFLDIEKKAFIPLLTFLQYKNSMSKKTDIYYVDSTPLTVCRNQRIHRHKTFKGIAKRGKSSMGWFYGFKLHILTNSMGEIMSFKITKGNVHDNKPVIELARNLTGRLFGDKGYLGKKLKEKLKNQSLNIVTKVRSNMKKKYEESLSKLDKFLLSKRGMIETTIGQIKEQTNITTTKIKNKFNYFINIISSLVAYQMKPNKPKLHLARVEMQEVIG